MHRILQFLVLSAALTISGCATFTAPKNFDPSNNPNDGLVLVSFDQSYPVVKWMYRNLDSGKGVKGLNENFISTTEKFNDLIYNGIRIIYPFKLKPGRYEFFRWTTPEFGPYTQSTNDFSIEFEVLPGAVTYIGNIILYARDSRYSIKIRNESEPDIRDFLAEYPRIKREDVKTRLSIFKGFSE